MEIFRLLDKSNCRKCGEKTCLAFAGAVFKDHRNPGECPKLDPETINLFFDKTAERNLDNGSIFTLGAGLAQMFEKLALRHGFTQGRSSQ